MGIFDRREDGDEDEEEAGSSSGPQASPQGWFDRKSEWPSDANTRYLYLFEHPGAAASHHVDAGRKLLKLGPPVSEEPDTTRVPRLKALEAYILALQALQLEPHQIEERQCAFGRLSFYSQEHLKAAPWILHYRSCQSLLEQFAATLKETNEAHLQAEGEAILKAIQVGLKAFPEPPVGLMGLLTPPKTAPTSQEKKEASSPEAPPVPAPPETTPGAEIAPPSIEPADVPPPPLVASPAAPSPDAPTAPQEPPPPALATQAVPDPQPLLELTAEKIFRVLLEECLKDGKISQAESRAIRQIRQVLQIDVERHRLLAETVQASYQSGELRGSEDMDPLTFFEKICRLALQDGVVSGAEQRLLQSMASYLHVTKEEFQDIRQRIKEHPGIAKV